MKTSPIKSRPVLLGYFLTLAAILSLAQSAAASGVTSWSGAGADQNWSTAGNWISSGGSIPPAAGDTVVFLNGPYPVATNVNGAVDNIVSASTSIGSLVFTNYGPTGNFHTTQINAGQTLTVNGLVTVGFSGKTVTDGMTGTGNFTANNVGGSFDVGGSGGSTETSSLTLAGGTNTINASKLSVGESAGNNGRQCTLNLGNGFNLIYVDNLNAGSGKAQGTIQFPAAATNGQITIRNSAGTGRAAITLGNSSSSGSSTARGSLLLAGHPADVMASLLEISGTNASAGTGSATGTNTMDNGTLDTTSIRMGENSPGNNTHPTSIGVLTIGGNPTNSATLVVNSPSGPGGGSFVLSAADGPWTNDSGVFITTLTGQGTFTLGTNGTARIYTSISEAAPTNNNGTVSVTGGTLIMEAATNTIGTPAIPIDNMTLDFATLQFSENGSSINAAVKTLNLNDTNVVNVAALPPISTLPTVIPIITYTSLGSSFNLGLGTLPGTYHGFLTNDGVSTISLVITGGTVVAKADLWGGGVNNNWDTNSLNWTNAAVAVKYNEGDFVTFADAAVANNVNLVGAHTPATLTVTNNSLNYTFSGTGSIIGSSSLVKFGSATLTLADSGGDSFAGGLKVHGGTVVLDNPNCNISGGLTNDNGTVVQIGNNDANGALPSGNVDDEGTLVFNRTDNFSLTTTIVGGGGLTQNGSGTLSVSAANTYTGNTVIGNGTLALIGSGSIASPLTLVKNATLDVSGAAGSVSLNGLAATNGILIVSNVSATVSALNLTNSTISLVTTVGGSATVAATSLTTGGTTNRIKITSIQNLPDPPTLPIVVPLVSYSSASFGGGFHIGLVPPPGIGGYISNDVANSTLDLVITLAPQTITWNGGSSTDNYWSDAANWTGTAIDPADSLVFDGTARLNNTNDTPAGTLYSNITLNTSAFILNGNPINLPGTLLNNAGSTQTVNVAFNLTGSPTFDGGFGGGALAVNGGITNLSNLPQTVTLLNSGTLNDLWATNSGASGGGQLGFVVGSGGIWTILDGTGSGALVPVGNLLLGVSANGSGGELDFGSVSSAPKVDGGSGSISINSPSSIINNTFNLNNGLLKVNSMNLPGTGAGIFNMNGGTLVLGSGSFQGGGGAGGAILTAAINGGAIYSTNGGVFQVTARCAGTLTVNAGLLQCGTLEISAGQASSGNGIINLDGGTVICSEITCGLFSGNAASTLNFNGGMLQAAGNDNTFISQHNLAPLTLNISTNGAVINTAGFNDAIGFALNTDPGLGGAPDGGLLKLGTGTLTLGGASVYVGDTVVSNGTLAVNGSIGQSAVRVLTGGTLSGNGSFGSNVTVNAGGTIAPGAIGAIGTLTVVSNVTLQGTTAMDLDAATATNDLINAGNAITYGGTLALTNLAGTLTSASTFKLFNAPAYSGVFTAISPAIPAGGLAWNTNTLTTDGILRLVATVNTNPTNITAVVSGHILTLSWPADHTGWRLQVQTNSLAAGLNTNWSTVSGSTSVNSTNITINPANGTVFYRLVYP